MHTTHFKLLSQIKGNAINMIFLKVIISLRGHFDHLPWTSQNIAVLLNRVSVLVDSPVIVLHCAYDEFFVSVITWNFCSFPFLSSAEVKQCITERVI